MMRTSVSVLECSISSWKVRNKWRRQPISLCRSYLHSNPQQGCTCILKCAERNIAPAQWLVLAVFLELGHGIFSGWSLLLCCHPGPPFSNRLHQFGGFMMGNTHQKCYAKIQYVDLNTWIRKNSLSLNFLTSCQRYAFYRFFPCLGLSRNCWQSSS